MILYLLYLKFQKSRVGFIITTVLSCISIILTSLGFLDEIISPYINPLIWMLYFSSPSEILAINFVLGLASHMIDQKAKIALRLGRESFAIYLLNVPIAGIITNITTKFNLWYLTLLRPIIAIMLAISSNQYILKNLKVPKVACMLIGSRK